MLEYLLKEKDKAKAALVYHAEQMQRADIKLEIIHGMIEEMKRAAAEKEPVETVTEEHNEETETVAVE
jgi:hypothetical protein